jgi:predicted Rossmann fold flavoprotein
MRKRLIVIGGGPAGFFCAANAARMSPALEVVILEKSEKVLSKLKLSGGGRCNLTNGCVDPSEMARQYPRGGRFMKRALYLFSASDTVRWFEERGVKVKQEPDGRMFPTTDSSQTVVDCLMEECRRGGVKWMVNKGVSRLEAGGGVWQVGLEGQTTDADFVCVSCGGHPKPDPYGWLSRLGHTIVEPVPSLFTFKLAGSPITSLMGVSVQDVSVKVVGTRLVERGPILITHWGLSGPAVLRLSAWGAREMAALGYDFRVAVNWVPAVNEEALRGRLQSSRKENAARKLRNANPFGLPQRIWEYQLQQSGIDLERRWGDLPGSEMKRLIGNLSFQEFAVRGKTNFKEEFVTAGGVKLGEVDPGTMMSKRLPGLFFAGEILDVDGITGGFNLQHAWTSGFIAARGIAQSA